MVYSTSRRTNHEAQSPLSFKVIIIALLDFRNFRVLKNLPFHFQNFVDIPIARETCKTFNKVKTHAILLITAKKLDKGRDLKDVKKK